MGQSLVKNYVHIIFSTKHREPTIDPLFETELHAYIGGICNELECPVLVVGGYVDHIHILCLLSKKIALMNLVRTVKAKASKWFKTKDISLESFYWQDGYGAFSVNQNKVDIVVRYIKNQKQHHRKINFKDEFISLLKDNEVEYDEKFVWD